MDEIEQFARLANELADRAREITRDSRALARDKGRERGFDPVTPADLEAERVMSETILKRFPGHCVTGEEFGRAGAEASSYCWSLDPIDGTRSFMCGLAHWVTLVALLKDGEPVLGLIDAPRLGERYIGYGSAASLLAGGESRRLRTSGCAALAEARLSTTDPFLFEAGAFDAFGRIRREARVTRFGLDGYAYAKLAAGDLDLVVEAGLKPHDLNALIPVVRNSGGAIGDWRGGTDFGRGEIVAAASKPLYDEAVALLGSG